MERECSMQRIYDKCLQSSNGKTQLGRGARVKTILKLILKYKCEEVLARFFWMGIRTTNKTSDSIKPEEFFK
jgi:hypothetical protein